MAAKLQPIDISDSTEVLNLAEEVRQSGIGRLLKRGEQELAVLTPVDPPLATSTSSDSRQKAPDAILNIIGIGTSAEPTDIAAHEQDYLTEASMPTSR